MADFFQEFRQREADRKALERVRQRVENHSTGEPYLEVPLVDLKAMLQVYDHEVAMHAAASKRADAFASQCYDD
jgi:hypothetical protein